MGPQGPPGPPGDGTTPEPRDEPYGGSFYTVVIDGKPADTRVRVTDCFRQLAVSTRTTPGGVWDAKDVVGISNDRCRLTFEESPPASVANWIADWLNDSAGPRTVEIAEHFASNPSRAVLLVDARLVAVELSSDASPGGERTLAIELHPAQYAVIACCSAPAIPPSVDPDDRFSGLVLAIDGISGELPLQNIDAFRIEREYPGRFRVDDLTFSAASDGSVMQFLETWEASFVQGLDDRRPVILRFLDGTGMPAYGLHLLEAGIRKLDNFRKDADVTLVPPRDGAIFMERVAPM